ncbi:MAG: 16S rRNA (cytosine1402-N4)-methyltransferase [Flavobacteriales bacterium]|jgi:16S rRNA (cytosine1402-N4)-methyltransferase
MKNDSKYHIPVLLKSSVEGLNIVPSGIFVDVTFGGGGHSRKILESLDENGKLFAFDQDAEAHENSIDDSRFTLIDQNFAFIKNYLAFHGIEKVDGILADLGVSSHQFVSGERGFSIRYEGDLDMRMDQSQELSAKRVVNDYEEDRLEFIFKTYGEIRNARLVARKIIEARESNSIETTTQLIDIVKLLTIRKKENQFLAQVFQAIRIEVNQELEVLKQFLVGAQEVLKPGGRLVVISYHSLEDRLVKNFIKKGKFEGEIEKDFYGNPLVDMKDISRKAIVADAEELKLNSRSRSAKMRIAEKL